MQSPVDRLQLQAGVDYPRSEAEFSSLLNTTEKCLALMAKLAEWPGARRCPTCRSEMKISSDPSIASCTNDKCSHQESLTQGTIFQRTRTDIAIWVFAAWLIVDTKDGLSAIRLADLLSIHPKAFRPIDTNLARTMLLKYREVMSGANARIELSTPVMGAIKLVVSKHPPVTVMIMLEDHGPRKLGQMRAHIVEAAVDPSPPGDEVQHSEPHIGSDSQPTRKAFLLNYMAGRINKFLAEDYGGSVRAEHLQGYLDEFVFRWNHRDEMNRGKVFCHLLAEAMSTKKAMP